MRRLSSTPEDTQRTDSHVAHKRPSGQHSQHPGRDHSTRPDTRAQLVPLEEEGATEAGPDTRDSPSQGGP